jgi:hypothetical protein
MEVAMKRLISSLGVIIIVVSLAFFLTSCADNPVGLSSGKPSILNKGEQPKLLK